MKTIRHKKQEDNKNAIGSVVAGVAGAVAIAGVAVAATMALKNEKTRKKVKGVLIDMKNQAIDYFDTLKTEPSAVRGVRLSRKIANNKNSKGNIASILE
ncbi:MAG: hypothetical protein Q8O88_04370 [bacterium]|nr:hypothetical protein [bacterium]